MGVPADSRSWAVVSRRRISCERTPGPARAATSAGVQISPGRNPVSTSRVSMTGRGQHPPGDLLVAERLPAHQVGVGIGVRLEPEQRRAVPADRDAEHRVERRPGPTAVSRALVHQRLEPRPVEVAQHQAVAVVVDERPVGVRRIVLVLGSHAVSSAFSSDTDSLRARPGDATIASATSTTHPNATITSARPGLASGNGITLRQIV